MYTCWRVCIVKLNIKILLVSEKQECCVGWQLNNQKEKHCPSLREKRATKLQSPVHFHWCQQTQIVNYYTVDVVNSVSFFRCLLKNGTHFLFLLSFFIVIILFFCTIMIISILVISVLVILKKSTFYCLYIVYY